MSYELREIEIVSGGKAPVSIRGNGNMSFSPAQLDGTVRMWGQADITQLLKTFSGVSSAGDYGAGMMIDGAESSQVLYRLGRVPVFFPYRFGGIFSTFNSSHMSRADFRRNILNASTDGRLGAVLDFEAPLSRPAAPGGEVSVGLISSSLTLRAPIGGKFGVTASARISYFDLLIGRIIRSEDSDIRYNFGDFNLTALYFPDEENRISLNIFHSSDRLHYADDNYVMDTRLDWKNSLVSLAWSNSGRAGMNHRIFCNGFAEKLAFALPQMQFEAPSSLSSAGASGEFMPRQVSGRWDVGAGYEYQHYFNRPQWVAVYGINDRENHEAMLRNADEGRLWGSASFHISPELELEGGISAILYHSHAYTRFIPDPRLTLSFTHGNNRMTLHAGRYAQFIQQLGFSETGLASDFWIVAGRRIPEQQSWGLSADWSSELRHTGISFDLNVYWRRVINQSEFSAQILDIINEDYDPEDYILTGRGHNLGANLTAGWVSGDWTLNLSAGYGVARQRFPGFEGSLRGRTDPGTSFSTLVLWNPGKLTRWTFSAAFRLNSGRPYTPVKAMYLIAGNIITEFGSPNSARLPLYHRLDISATWKLTARHGRTPGQSLNFSLINVYGHRNVEFYKGVLDATALTGHMQSVASLYRFIPSVSYTLSY